MIAKPTTLDGYSSDQLDIVTRACLHVFTKLGDLCDEVVEDVLTRSPRLSTGYPVVTGPLPNCNFRPLRPWRLSNGSLMSCGTRRSWST